MSKRMIVPERQWHSAVRGRALTLSGSTQKNTMHQLEGTATYTVTTHSALRVHGTPAGAGGAQTNRKQMPVAQSESWSLRQPATLDQGSAVGRGRRCCEQRSGKPQWSGCQ